MFYGTIFLQQVWLFQSQFEQVDDGFVSEITFTESLFHNYIWWFSHHPSYLLLTLDRSFEFRGPHQEIADQGPKISTFTVVNGHSFTNARSGLLQ